MVSPFLCLDETSQMVGKMLFSKSLEDVENHFIDLANVTGPIPPASMEWVEETNVCRVNVCRQIECARKTDRVIVLMNQLDFIAMRDNAPMDLWLRPTFETIGRWRKVAETEMPMADFYVGPIPRHEVICFEKPIEVYFRAEAFAYPHEIPVQYDRRLYGELA